MPNQHIPPHATIPVVDPHDLRSTVPPPKQESAPHAPPLAPPTTPAADAPITAAPPTAAAMYEYTWQVFNQSGQPLRLSTLAHDDSTAELFAEAFIAKYIENTGDQKAFLSPATKTLQP